MQIDSIRGPPLLGSLLERVLKMPVLQKSRDQQTAQSLLSLYQTSNILNDHVHIVSSSEQGLMLRGHHWNIKGHQIVANTRVCWMYSDVLKTYNLLIWTQPVNHTNKAICTIHTLSSDFKQFKPSEFDIVCWIGQLWYPLYSLKSFFNPSWDHDLKTVVRWRSKEMFSPS